MDMLLLLGPIFLFILIVLYHNLRHFYVYYSSDDVDQVARYYKRCLRSGKTKTIYQEEYVKKMFNNWKTENAYYEWKQCGISLYS